MVIIGLVVPCAPVVVSLVRSGYASLSPSILCSPKDGAAAFYSLVLPVSALLATGISLHACSHVCDDCKGTIYIAIYPCILHGLKLSLTIL